jgi:penicillin amidase
MTSGLTPEARAAALPPLDGDLAVPGLVGPVTVWRDAWGIPHIRAGTPADAYHALGFVHAQDRLFQMDLNRRRALGRTAEWFGPKAVSADALVRRLGMAAACERDYAALGFEAREMLDAYAAGVNAFLGSGAPLPCEYALLSAEPDTWMPWHSIAVMRRLGLLMGSFWFKLWRMLALPIVGPENAMKLRYDDGPAHDLLCIPPGETAERFAADLSALAPAVEALLAALGAETGEGTGGGSNNWAVGPGRSATGRPVLAGDPHRVFEIPGMYAQHHLACDAFDVIGLTVPGVPGFPHFAHNGRVAYCVTHAFLDIHDLYLERFEDEGRRVAVSDGFETVRIRQERIAVRGEADRTIVIAETRNGPVIAGDPRSGTALSVRSVQFAETDLSFDCLPRMARAGTVAELFEATRGWGLIDHNLVAGDTAGAIGHLVRARVPRRPRANGWLPVPGWSDASAWTGWIPYEAMPCTIDPPGGIIVTANNRVVADDHPDYLCTDCHPAYRAERIQALLTDLAPFGPGDAGRIHADVRSPLADLFRDRLRGIEMPDDTLAAAFRAVILVWDGEMDARSEGAAAYVRLRRSLTRLVAERSGLARAAGHPWASEVPPTVSPEGQVWWALPTWLRQGDESLLSGLSWNEAFAEALELAACDGEPAPWGTLHQPRFMHPLADTFPEAASLLNPPSQAIGGDGDTVLATGIAPAFGTAATYGALARYVFDVGDWEACRWSVFHGTSGHPGSPHYADQNAPWSVCAMVPMHYDWDVVAQAAVMVQTLRPAATR